MLIITILLTAAFACFLIPAIKALFRNSFDFTNTGLACLTGALLFTNGVL